MTTRRSLLGLLAVGAGCRSPGEKVEILPMNLGEWQRLSVEFIPPEEHPEHLKRRGIKQARRATYQSPSQGHARLTASVYQFGAQAVAFELVQQWRPESRAIAFHQGPYFVTLRGEQDDVKLLNQFAALLETSLGGK